MKRRSVQPSVCPGKHGSMRVSMVARMALRGKCGLDWRALLGGWRICVALLHEADANLQVCPLADAADAQAQGIAANRLPGARLDRSPW